MIQTALGAKSIGRTTSPPKCVVAVETCCHMGPAAGGASSRHC